MESTGSGASFQGPFFPLQPLLRYLNSTPEQVSFVERYLSRAPIPERQRPEPAPGAALPGPGQYSLRREGACWVLHFKNGYAYLRPELGLEYVAWLLAHPGQWLAAIELFSRFSRRDRKQLPPGRLPQPESASVDALNEGLAIEEFCPDDTEEEARNVYYAKLREYQQTAQDTALPEAERREARRSYEELRAFLKKDYRQAPSPGRAQTKLVNRCLQRFCKHLRQSAPGEATPNPVAVAFAEYIERNILVPSRRYTQAKSGACVRLARGELAGRLVFECPAADQWSVRF